jgi:hypothetical protein
MVMNDNQFDARTQFSSTACAGHASALQVPPPPREARLSGSSGELMMPVEWLRLLNGLEQEKFERVPPASAKCSVTAAGG